MSSASYEGMHDSHTQATFQAFVDAVIPPTLHFAQSGVIPIPGALNLCIHDYVIWDLDHSQYIPPTGNPNITPLSKSTAILLDLGAEQFIRTSQAVQPQDSFTFPGGRLFSTLSRSDRLRTVMLLDRLDISLQALPLPYQNNPALIQVMMSSINQLTLFGYYSEWFGYGSTRLFTPDFRRLECYPPSWGLVGYPGPSFGYREFRGFILR
ncbi:MAG: hypothetical protein ACQEXQ_05075 [Bacillota bacterium]